MYLDQLLRNIRAVRAGRSLPAIHEYMLSIAKMRANDDPVRTHDYQLRLHCSRR